MSSQSKGKKKQRTVSMSRRYLIGLCFLGLIFASILILLLTLNIPLTNSVLKWTDNTSSPFFVLSFLATLFACFSWGLLYLLLSKGMKLTVKAFVLEGESKTININRNYLAMIFGVPVPIIGVLAVISAVGLFALRPRCEAPIISYRVESSSAILNPNDTIAVKINKSLIITAFTPSSNGSPIICEWSASGLAIARIEFPNQCTTSIKLSSIPASGLLTSVVAYPYCSRIRSTSLKIEVEAEP